MGCMQRTVVSEPNLPSAQSASVAHFSCCEHTGQSFVPVLSVVQSGATVGLLLDGVSSHTRCLPSLHLLRLQLHGVYVIIFTPSQDRSHFGVVLVPVGPPAGCVRAGATLEGRPRSLTYRMGQLCKRI